MKLKGINPFEQHIEKIVLGVAVAAVGGVAAWQYLAAPAVKVGGKDVGPNEVDPLLEKRASKLQSQLRGESNITIPTDGVKFAAPSFGSDLDKAVTPSLRLAVASPSFADTLIKTNASTADIWYYEPKLAAVTMKSVMQTADALTAESAKQALAVSPSLKSHFTSSEGPQDVVWTTPVATIDVKGIRAELARSDSQAKPARASIPGVWYLETPFVVDVSFERREVNEDGTFGASAKVPAFIPPETLNYRGSIGSASRALQEDVFKTLKDPAEQMQIVQRPFYDTVNDSFVSPALSEQGGAAPVGNGESARLILQKKTQLEKQKLLAAKLAADLKKLGGEYDDAVEKEKEAEKRRDEQERKDAEHGGKKSGGGKQSGGGGGFGGGGGGGGMGGQNMRQQKDNKDDSQAKRDLEQRKVKTTQLRKVEKDIAALEAALGATPTPTAAAVKLPSLLTDDAILTWGHDLEVEPGHKYQYRCSIQVYNPFFARGNQLVKEQDDKGLSQAFVLDSRVSEWSQTVTVSPRVRFFVTKASAGDGGLGMGTAQVEVYRLVDGQWRRSEMQVQPGERIGRMANPTHAGGKEVDFTTDYYVASIVEDLEVKGAGDRVPDRSRKPAFVVVRPLGSGAEFERRPDDDFNDVERVQLREDAANTAAAEEHAAEKPPVKNPNGGGGGPGGPPGGGPGGGGLNGGGSTGGGKGAGGGTDGGKGNGGKGSGGKGGGTR